MPIPPLDERIDCPICHAHVRPRADGVRICTVCGLRFLVGFNGEILDPRPSNGGPDDEGHGE